MAWSYLKTERHSRLNIIQISNYYFSYDIYTKIVPTSVLHLNTSSTRNSCPVLNVHSIKNIKTVGGAPPINVFIKNVYTSTGKGFPKVEEGKGEAGGELYNSLDNRGIKP
jgi:hypothetical protein